MHPVWYIKYTLLYSIPHDLTRCQVFLLLFFLLFWNGATVSDNVEKSQQSVRGGYRTNLADGWLGVLRQCICILQLTCILSCLWHIITVVGPREERGDGGGGMGRGRCILCFCCDDMFWKGLPCSLRNNNDK